MGLQKKQNLHISELVQLIFDLNIKTERFSIKIAPKHIIFDYLWDKKETNKLFRLVCLFWCAWRDSNPRHLASEASALSSWATDADVWKIAFQRFSTYEIIGKNRSISNSGQFVVWLPLTTAFLRAQITLHRTKTSLKPVLSQLSENYDRAA